MIANAAPAYLIDGFPRSTDQALFFEQNVLECQRIVHFKVSEETMFKRCQKRAESSGRADDNPETMKKRVANYKETSEPVIEYYDKFGKVFTIDSEASDINAIYAEAREAVLPQLFFSMGPPASAQDVVAANVTTRSNMRHLKWPNYLAENGLTEASDDDKILKLIDDLAVERTPRVFLEQFPENLYQAKFFIRNCKAPSHVFNMVCSQDVCQERMVELGANSPGYLSSGILAQKIKAYNAVAQEILPYLKEQVGAGFRDIDAEKTVAQILTQVRSAYEPTIIHIRPGPDTHGVKQEVTAQLTKELADGGLGFMNLDINALNRLEAERKTAIGLEMHQMVQGSKTIPAEMIIRMLKMIIFNGDPKKDKFILTSFPDIIEQAGAFEEQCAKITTIFYTTRGEVVEIKNNAL